MTVNLSETPQIPWNYVNATTNVVETFSSSVFGNLIDHDGREGDVFTLVKNYSCKDNVCKVNIKNNIKFHNGREVTAHDVEFSLTRLLLQNKEDNFAYTILNDIEGIDNLKKPKMIQINNIYYPKGILDGIKVIDNFNFEIYLKHKNRYILQKISTGYLPIVPIEELKDNYIDWKLYPVGFGRYKLVKADLLNHQFILEKTNNEDIPKYIRIIFTDKDEGDLRILSHMTESKFDGNIIFSNVYVNGGFLFNFSTKLGADPNFRKAISLALDREKIANLSKLNDLIAEDQMLPKYSWLERFRDRSEITKQNVQLAKEYLNKVPKNLWENKTLDVHTFWTLKSNIEDIDYIKEIKNQLAEIGLKIKFHNTDFNYSKFNKIDNNVLWWTGFDTQTDDPNANFSYFKKGSFFDNIYPVDDKKYLHMLEDSVKNFTSNPNYTRELSKYFKDNNYMVVVLNVKKRFSYKKDRVKFLESQYNGVRLEMWKIKLINYKLF